LRSASQAAIVETIIDPDTDTTVGSITFPTFAGDSKAGVLFSFGAFTQADITSISWTLDPTTAAVASFDLGALQGDNPCPNGTPSCSNTTLSLSSTLATFSGISCSSSGDTGECASFFSQEDITLVPAAVPEPSAWAMMVVGLVGLGVAGRQSRKAAAG
jgi:PEP-CTERM motif